MPKKQRQSRKYHKQTKTNTLQEAKPPTVTAAAPQTLSKGEQKHSISSDSPNLTKNDNIRKELDELRVKKKLDSREEYRIVELLSKFEDSTTSSLSWSDGFRRMFQGILLAVSLVMLSFIPDAIRGKKAGITGVVCGVCAALYCYVRQLRPPADPDRRSNWFDTYGRALAFLYMIYPAIFAICVVPFLPASGILLAIGSGMISIYSIILMTILSRPHLLLNRKLTAFGSYLVTAGTITCGIGFLFTKEHLDPVQYVMLTALSAAIAGMLGINIMGDNALQINPIERLSFQIIRPDRLFVAIKNIHSEIEETQAALGLMDKLMKDGKFGVVAELNREFARRYGGKTNKFLSFMLMLVAAVLLATIGAIYEGLVQGSLPFNKLRLFLCSHISWICN